MVIRDSVLRRYNAVKLGRILPDKKPQFIGSWDIDMNERGLFEVYINKKDSNGGVRGVIEDTFGSAFFSGRIANGQIKLSKLYDNLAIKNGGASEKITYYGELKNWKYEGNFNVENCHGNFWMNEFR